MKPLLLFLAFVAVAGPVAKPALPAAPQAPAVQVQVADIDFETRGSDVVAVSVTDETRTPGALRVRVGDTGAWSSCAERNGRSRCVFASPHPAETLDDVTFSRAA